jgi:hypothetical protein
MKTQILVFAPEKLFNERRVLLKIKPVKIICDSQDVFTPVSQTKSEKCSDIYKRFLLKKTDAFESAGISRGKGRNFKITCENL